MSEEGKPIGENVKNIEEAKRIEQERARSLEAETKRNTETLAPDNNIEITNGLEILERHWLNGRLVNGDVIHLPPQKGKIAPKTYNENGPSIIFADDQGRVFVCPSTSIKRNALIGQGYKKSSYGVPMQFNEVPLNQFQRELWESLELEGRVRGYGGEPLRSGDIDEYLDRSKRKKREK